MKKIIFTACIALFFIAGCEYFEEDTFTVYYLVSGETQNAEIRYLDEDETEQAITKSFGDWEYSFTSTHGRVNYFVNVVVYDGKQVDVYVKKSTRDWFVSCDDECGINTVCGVTVKIEL